MSTTKTREVQPLDPAEFQLVSSQIEADLDDLEGLSNNTLPAAPRIPWAWLAFGFVLGAGFIALTSALLA